MNQIRGCGWAVAAMLVLSYACQSDNESKMFSKLSAGQTGIDFSNQLIETDTNNILYFEFYYNGSGVSAADINNDGWTDLFFGSNMGNSKLYLNNGDFTFEDITEKAGINTAGKWVTGVNLIDINHDGWLDIYVSVGGNFAKDYTNQLYVSNASSEQLQFTEVAAEVGLADQDYSTQSAFFDYDLDGDLDMYLVTSAMNIPNKNRIRRIRKDGSMRNTDHLYRNDGIDALTGLPKFTNVSREAGILYDGFGLGVCITDINKDGYPDVYVANDYISNDLLYINQKNGRFENKIDSFFSHLSYSAMGTDIADINNDGHLDVVAVDMLPPDNFRKRIMAGNGRSYNRYLIEKEEGYTDQYIRNTLQINNGDGTYSELGQLAGVHETDWSWAPVIADFNNDGWRDLFIANGIPSDITNMDFISYEASQAAYSIPSLLEQLKKMGDVKISNYMFKNNGNLSFENVTETWGLDDESFSNSALYVDLDNDGDLDIVTNNTNEKAFVYKNNIITADSIPHNANYLQIVLKGDARNPQAIGSTIELSLPNKKLVHEYTPVRGFMSSQDYKAHFGLGSDKTVATVTVQWPDGKMSQLKHVTANQKLLIDKSAATVHDPTDNNSQQSKAFIQVNSVKDIQYHHEEKEFNDFKIQRLAPHQFSKEGPGIAVADVNNDGLEDFYIGGANAAPGKIYMQRQNGTFRSYEIDAASNHEDMGVLFFDADQDGDADLYVVSGGSGLAPEHPLYKDRLYVNDGKGNFRLDINALPDIRVCGSKVTAADFDKDGDLDVFIGGRVSLENYPKPPQSQLLINESAQGKIAFRQAKMEAIDDLGMVKDAIWSDYNNDGWQDLMICGEWTPITILKNQEGKLINVSSELQLSSYTGWWNSLSAADFDKDGDIDYVVGNLGLNNRFSASADQPLEIHAKDFDQNGSIDPICTYYNQGKRHPIYSRDLLYNQLPILQKRIPSYQEYAQAALLDIFTEEELQTAYVQQATTLASVYIENTPNGFIVHELPLQAQVAPVYGTLVLQNKLLAIGNSYSSDVESGHYDALKGIVLQFEKNEWKTELPLTTGFKVTGDGKGIAHLNDVNGNTIVLAAQNDADLLAYQSEQKWQQLSANTDDVYALITYQNEQVERREFYYGGNYLSHASRAILRPQNATKVEIFNTQGEGRIVFNVNE